MLPTKSAENPVLKNVLSISTAGKNRFLFYFNSHHSLTQWTAGIRLSLFELTMLQEAYTGALIGSKAKSINGINGLLIQRTRFKYGDWARVRFAAGEPWNKYWTVITPPDEKSYQKWKKEIKKGKEPYEALEFGNIKFYTTKKTKKAIPVATITKAFSCYAIYPQSEALIDHSTLLKIEGQIHVQSAAEPREGFVFIMPDIHPGVSGFEMMVRWILPAFDAFHLYGRPQRLAADAMDIKSLMFGMLHDPKYGHLEVTDVAHLISASQEKVVAESEWRHKLKDLTLRKLQNTQHSARSSLPVQMHISPVVLEDNRSSVASSPAIPYPPQHSSSTPSIAAIGKHHRSISEAHGDVSYRGRATMSNERSSTASPTYTHNYQTGTRDSSYDRYDRSSSNPSDVGDASGDGGLFSHLNTRTSRYSQQELPESVPFTPAMTHVPSSRPTHPLPPTPGYQSRISAHTMDAMVQGTGNIEALRQNGMYNNSYENARQLDEDLSRRSYESNIFEDLSPRTSDLPPNTTTMSTASKTDLSSTSNSFTPLPSPVHNRSQITNQDLPNFVPGYVKSAAHGVKKYDRTSWELEGERQGVYGDDDGHSSPTKGTTLGMYRVQQQPTTLRTNKLEGKMTSEETFSSAATPTSSIESIADHAINAEAWGRLSQDVDLISDTETTSNLKKAVRIDSENQSEDVIDDYDSTDAESEVVRLPPRIEGARSGVMKTVGQKPANGILIGDSHYKPLTSPVQHREPTSEIPKIDFGRTFNHGRNLSATMSLDQSTKAAARGNEQPTELSYEGHNGYTGPADAKALAQPNLDSGLSGAGHRRIPSAGSSAILDEGKRPSHLRQPTSQDPGDNKGSQGSDNRKTAPSGRTMTGQPGLMQQPGGSIRSTNRSEVSERHDVVEQLAVARQQSQVRSRYLHSKRPSRNFSAEQIPRPPSQVGNVLLPPQGLLSSPDLSSHLSAREQEYIARRTGTTLLQIESRSARKQPPHQAGLLGAIETREKEKQGMMWKSGQLLSNNATVQQALAQRQLHARTVSSSSRNPAGRVTVQPYSQGLQSQQYTTQSEFVQQLPQLGYVQPQQQSFSQNFGSGYQSGSGTYNGR